MDKDRPARPWLIRRHAGPTPWQIYRLIPNVTPHTGTDTPVMEVHGRVYERFLSARHFYAALNLADRMCWLAAWTQKGGTDGFTAPDHTTTQQVDGGGLHGAAPAADR